MAITKAQKQNHCCFRVWRYAKKSWEKRIRTWLPPCTIWGCCTCTWATIHRIRTSGDTAVVGLFQKWEASRSQLNRCLQSTDSTERAAVDSLMAATEKMEKVLSLRSEAFGNLAERKLANWKQVQKKLKPGEAAVEMVRVTKFGIRKMVIDSSEKRKPAYHVKGVPS